MRKSLLIAATTLVLVSCRPLIDKEGVRPQERPSQERMPDGYETYEEGDGEGEAAVLFFFSSTDTESLKKDEALKKLYAEAEVPLTVYQVQFGAHADLEARYGVILPDTFVLIDASGDLVKKEESASFTSVKRLLFGNVGTAKPAEDAEEPSDDDDEFIESYEDCIDAGYPMMKSYPPQCRTKGGKHFVQELDDVEDVPFDEDEP